MDRLVKQKHFFLDNKKEMDKTTSQKRQEVFYEGQNVNDSGEQEGQEETTENKKKKKFIASYNMFF